MQNTRKKTAHKEPSCCSQSTDTCRLLKLSFDRKKREKNEKLNEERYKKKST